MELGGRLFHSGRRISGEEIRKRQADGGPLFEGDVTSCWENKGETKPDREGQG